MPGDTRNYSKTIRAIDKIVLHHTFGIPIFLLVYGLFTLTVKFGVFSVLMDAITHAL